MYSPFRHRNRDYLTKAAQHFLAARLSFVGGPLFAGCANRRYVFIRTFAPVIAAGIRYHQGLPGHTKRGLRNPDTFSTNVMTAAPHTPINLRDGGGTLSGLYRP